MGAGRFFITPESVDPSIISVFYSVLIGLIPLILFCLVIHFLIQIKRGLDDLSLEMQNTREAIRVSVQRPVQPPNIQLHSRPPSVEGS